MLYLSSGVAMLAVRLPPSIEKRLEKLARRTGRTKTYYVREAILTHLADLEVLYLAEGTLKPISTGEEQKIPMKDGMTRNRLEESPVHLVSPPPEPNSTPPNYPPPPH